MWATAANVRDNRIDELKGEKPTGKAGLKCRAQGDLSKIASIQNQKTIYFQGNQHHERMGSDILGEFIFYTQRNLSKLATTINEWKVQFEGNQRQQFPRHLAISLMTLMTK